ncbi:MAG: hypothetical protein Q8R95_07180 [Azonexus sp.]|nr:hypothetical protein [Azonexus sp.]
MVYFVRIKVNILFVVFAHAVNGKQSFRFAVANGDAWCCDRLIIGKTLGDLGIQVEQLFEQASHELGWVLGRIEQRFVIL